MKVRDPAPLAVAGLGRGAGVSAFQSVDQITDFGRNRWFTAPEAVAYGLADEVIGDPAGPPESGTPE
jgi:hypothetical protein